MDPAVNHSDRASSREVDVLVRSPSRELSYVDNLLEPPSAIPVPQKTSRPVRRTRSSMAHAGGVQLQPTRNEAESSTRTPPNEVP